MVIVVFKQCLVLSRFSVFYVKKSECYFSFSCNQLAILTQFFSDSQAACCIFFFIRNSELFFRIYTGYSGSIWINVKIWWAISPWFFVSNQLQTLAQWSWGIVVVCNIFFLRNRNSLTGSNPDLMPPKRRNSKERYLYWMRDCHFSLLVFLSISEADDSSSFEYF